MYMLESEQYSLQYLRSSCHLKVMALPVQELCRFSVQEPAEHTGPELQELEHMWVLECLESVMPRL